MGDRSLTLYEFTRARLENMPPTAGTIVLIAACALGIVSSLVFLQRSAAATPRPAACQPLSHDVTVRETPTSLLSKGLDDDLAALLLENGQPADLERKSSSDVLRRQKTHRSPSPQHITPRIAARRALARASSRSSQLLRLRSPITSPAAGRSPRDVRANDPDYFLTPPGYGYEG